MSGMAVPSPVGGWNARDSLAEMPPTDAIELVNLVPNGDSVKGRVGHSAHTSDLGAAVKTLVTYHGATEKIIAGANGKIIDVTAGGTGTNLGTGFAENQWQTTEFKNRIIFCNGTDKTQDYDGTTLTETSLTATGIGTDLATNGSFAADSDWVKGTGWTIAAGVASCDGTQTAASALAQVVTLTDGAPYEITFTVSGYSAGTVTPFAGAVGGTARSANGTFTETISVDTGDIFGLSGDADFVGDIDDVSITLDGSANFISCTTHHGRVYYIEGNSQSFWYPSAGAYAGTLTEFDLGEFTTTGGDLLYMISWTRDGGSGIDDVAVFVLSTGELLVYAGSDPGSATDWSLLGRFRIGRPLGKRSATQIGGDVIILTVDGYVPLSAALQEGRYSEQSDFSFKIDTAAKKAAQTYKDLFGWEAIHWPQASWFVVNVPISTTESVQHVRNTTKGGWCKFTGLDASCWALYNDGLYFGSPDGTVFKMAGYSDNGAFIPFSCTQAFFRFGSPHQKKVVTAAMPITDFVYPKYIDIEVHTDYNIESLPTYDAPPEASPGDWDVGEWDVAEWTSGAAGEANVARKNVSGMGYAIAHTYRFKSRAQAVTWSDTQHWVKPAGIV